MTAALVQGILDRFLRKYIKNVTTEHATVLGGQLVFKNVELRLDVLQVYYLRMLLLADAALLDQFPAQLGCCCLPEVYLRDLCVLEKERS